MRTLILLAVLTIGFTPALADNGAATKAKPAKGSPEEIVCRREVATGSLVQGRRICMTRAQRAAQSEAAQREAGRLVDAGQINSCGATTPGGC